MDMRKWIKEKCELATVYAEDGAYHSAARVLADAAKETLAHAKRVDRELVKFNRKADRK